MSIDNIYRAEHLESFEDAQHRRWYAMTIYPRGKADKQYWMINLYRVGGQQGETFLSADKYLQRKMSLTQLRLC